MYKGSFFVTEICRDDTYHNGKFVKFYRSSNFYHLLLVQALFVFELFFLQSSLYEVIKVNVIVPYVRQYLLFREAWNIYSCIQFYVGFLNGL